MFDDDNKINWSVEMIANVKIRVHDQECIVTKDVWSKACDVLDIINEYTQGVDVHKVKTIKTIRDISGSGLRETKLMAEAYFEPIFERDSGKGWHRYT